MLLFALGGMVLHRINAGAAPAAWRRQVMLTHGVGLILTLVGGFGTLARLGIVGGLPGWIMAKLAIWALLGVLLVMLHRKPGWGKPLWWSGLAGSVVAAYLAINKPF
jgi:hypothetical protein